MRNRALDPTLSRASLHTITSRACTLHSSKQHHHKPSILSNSQLLSLTPRNRLPLLSLLLASLCSPPSPNSSSRHLHHPIHNSSRAPKPVHKASHHTPSKQHNIPPPSSRDHLIPHLGHSRGVPTLSNASLHHRSSLRIPLLPRPHLPLLWVPAKDRRISAWGCNHDPLAFQIFLVQLMTSQWVLRVL